MVLFYLFDSFLAFSKIITAMINLHFIISLTKLWFGKFAFKNPNFCFSVNLWKE